MPENERQEQFFKEQLPGSWSTESMAYLQDQDQHLRKVKAWFRERRHPDWQEVSKESTIVKTWWGLYEQLMLSANGVLYNSAGKILT